MTRTPPFMVCSTVTRKCSVLTQPKEGHRQVSVNLSVMYRLNAVLQGSRDFSQLAHSPPSTLILSHPNNASPCFGSLVMVEDHISLLLEKNMDIKEARQRKSKNKNHAEAVCPWK